MRSTIIEFHELENSKVVDIAAIMSAILLVNTYFGSIYWLLGFDDRHSCFPTFGETV